MSSGSPATTAVTSGAAFIGSALVRETDHLVVNIDKFTYASNFESLGDVAAIENNCFEQTGTCGVAALPRRWRSTNMAVT